MILSVADDVTWSDDKTPAVAPLDEDAPPRAMRLHVYLEWGRLSLGSSHNEASDVKESRPST
jgi:hypothetical protein